MGCNCGGRRSVEPQPVDEDAPAPADAAPWQAHPAQDDPEDNLAQQRRLERAQRQGD